MQRVITFGLLSVLAVAQGVTVAQSVSDSALGAWTLNRAKSTFSGPVPYGRVMKFEVAGDAIKETTYTFSTDKPSVVVEFTARFDGNDYPIPDSILNTVSLKRVDEGHGRADGQDSGAGRGDGNPNGLGQRQGVDGYHQRQKGRRGGLERSGLRETTTLHALLAGSSATIVSAVRLDLRGPDRKPSDDLDRRSRAVESIEMKARRAFAQELVTLPRRVVDTPLGDGVIVVTVLAQR